MAIALCPICKKKFESETSDALPFCTKRCREIDLGRWLGERYAFRTTRRTDDEDFEAESADESHEVE